MKSTLALAAAAALALAGCSKQADKPAAQGPIAAVPPPAGKSWTDIVVATPDGGMRMGNPDAPVKLVEYASFTCPHCRAFNQEGSDPLQKTYVATGKVSWEFRSFLIHGPDAPVTLLMNCRGPEPFFQLSDQLYASQDAWMAKLIAMAPAEQTRLQALSPTEQFKAMTRITGLYGFFGARGLPAAKADACLTDEKAIATLTAQQSRATTQDQVNSTPSFFINGQIQPDVADWRQLEPKLRAAIG